MFILSIFSISLPGPLALCPSHDLPLLLTLNSGLGSKSVKTQSLIKEKHYSAMNNISQ